ncbi:ras GTPase-activating protein family [Basidiobolus meristosporus CBS 931.73]|nr:ras GTPase-activating protein family [Basidiobolus meristosporus CBS 931.73]|eukprot:ORX63453.1 ras GTPase-activating protein family [Basidiobolus meristosporus CBS 931.73]
MDHYVDNMDKVVKAQAVFRGIQARNHLKQTLDHYHQNTDDIVKVQAVARGMLARKQKNALEEKLLDSISAVTSIQALARGVLTRKRIDDIHSQLHRSTPAIVQVQALARGMLARKEMDGFLDRVQSNVPAITQIQALARGVLTRSRLGAVLEHCLMFENEITQLQAMARGLLARRNIRGTLSHYYGYQDQVIRSQAIARGFLVRKRQDEIREYLRQRESAVHKLQAMARGVLSRKKVGGLLEHYATHEEEVIKVQQCVRGFIRKNQERKRWEHYVNNADKIIKVQSVFRAKLANNAYRTLTMVEDPPVSTMRNFIHLLDDGDKDFQEEMELERLRQQAVLTIRQNNELETHLNDLDIKIALLVKNRISLDEVIRASKRQYNVSDDYHAAASSLKSLDKDNRHKLECYQQLFYLLQTHPIYLARLLFIMNQNFMGDRTKKFVETVVLTLFGFAQNEREEYLLLKLFKAAIDVEISNVETVSDFLRGNPVFIKLAVHYNRGAKERKYLRELLQPLVKQIIEDPTLDLETDPLAIYRKLIREEESREGKKSNRPYDIPLDSALEDVETRQVLISHLKQLTTITTNFVNSIHNSLDKMPYGIRYIARELREALMAKLPNEQENTILKVVGNLVYYRYINPAIIAPETFDVIETNINPLQRKNLAEVAKMLNQVCVGKPFSNENVGLKALDSYVKFTSESFAQYSYNVTAVCDPEVYFQIDEFLDLANRQKPVIYINTSEVFSVHAMLEESLDMLAPEMDDPLRAVLEDLGPAPTIKSGFQDRELSLTLTNKLADLGEEESEVKQLFVETKRLVLYIIRIQSGRTLLDILERPVTNRDEKRFQEMIAQERAKGEGIKSNFDISGVDFLTLKKVTFDYLNLLEREGRVSYESGYQEMINSIATDVRNKHRRRIQRRQEMKRIRQTLLNLADKSNYLEEQKNTYLDYIHTCMSQLSQKKNKRSRVLPFTRQYFHLKDLQKSGKMPRFGSYKYTAERLAQKGVLLSMEQFSPKQFEKIAMTISSDEAGVFSIEAYMMGAKIADMILRLEDLLQLQFDNVNVTTLFDGAVTVNVNLLLFLINKKFYV